MCKMAVTIEQLETLRPGDYIEASELYFRVIRINTKAETLTMTRPFSKGERAVGITTFNYNDKVAKIDNKYWNIIRQNSPKAKGIERKVK
jgi:hypothetical protein